METIQILLFPRGNLPACFPPWHTTPDLNFCCVRHQSHAWQGQRHGFYYQLTQSTSSQAPALHLLSPDPFWPGLLCTSRPKTKTTWLFCFCFCIFCSSMCSARSCSRHTFFFFPSSCLSHGGVVRPTSFSHSPSPFFPCLFLLSAAVRQCGGKLSPVLLAS